MKKRICLDEFIKNRRKHLHLTQEQLAEKMNVSKSAIAKWETGGGIPERSNMLKLSEVLNVSVNDLYRLIDNKNERVMADVNITGDVIASLESYGYIVIEPKMEEGK